MEISTNSPLVCNFTIDQIEQKKIDDIALSRLNISVQEINERINFFLEKAEKELEGDKSITYTIIGGCFKVCWGITFANQDCNLCKPSIKFSNFHMGAIENRKNRKYFLTSTLMQHYISVHGFFGSDPLNRIDPAFACEVLDLPGQ